MTTARTAGYRSGLIDLDTGQISREIFVNEEIYAEEQERVFARAWLFVGHESQIPNPGDFLVSCMGEESVLLCRDRAANVHVFLNSCRHRGMKVCRYDEGNTAVFTCPYHGWSYGTDGRLVGVGPSGRSRRDYSELNAARKLHVVIPDRGHQTITYVLPKDYQPQAAYQNSPEVAEYFGHCEEERRRRPGANSRLIGAPGEIFPNVALLPRQPRTLAVWHPKSAHQTEVWRFFFVDRDAPQQVKNFLRDYYIRYSGPAGMTEQDDMENWNYAHAASRGTIARRHPYTYEMGLGHAIEDYEWEGLKMPGRVIDLTTIQASEEPMRNLYRRWAEFMEADSWDELMTWRRNDKSSAVREAQAAK